MKYNKLNIPQQNIVGYIHFKQSILIIALFPHIIRLKYFFGALSMLENVLQILLFNKGELGSNISFLFLIVKAISFLFFFLFKESSSFIVISSPSSVISSLKSFSVFLFV